MPKRKTNFLRRPLLIAGAKLRIVSADSPAAILDEEFTPLRLVASASVLVEAPYREAHIRLAEPIFREVENGQEAIVHEAELCLNMLEIIKADIVHLDISLGGLLVEELSPVYLFNMKLSMGKTESPKNSS